MQRYWSLLQSLPDGTYALLQLLARFRNRPATSCGFAGTREIPSDFCFSLSERLKNSRLRHWTTCSSYAALHWLDAPSQQPVPCMCTPWACSPSTRHPELCWRDLLSLHTTTSAEPHLLSNLPGWAKGGAAVHACMHALQARMPTHAAAGAYIYARRVSHGGKGAWHTLQRPVSDDHACCQIKAMASCSDSPAVTACTPIQHACMHWLPGPEHSLTCTRGSSCGQRTECRFPPIKSGSVT